MRAADPTGLIPILLAFCGHALAKIHFWPSAHVALGNGSVFVDLSPAHNATERNVTLSLVDMETNGTVLSRPVPPGLKQEALEIGCSGFLYAGSFRFVLEEVDGPGRWWSAALHVRWPTFHMSVDRSSTPGSASFLIGVSTNEHFQPCDESLRPLYLEVTYLEYNQVNRYSINKVRARTQRDLALVQSQLVQMDCVFPFTERDHVIVALRSHYTQQNIKSSGPLYLSRIFSYKLQVDNAYWAGCEGTVAVRLFPPPCAFTSGKVTLHRQEATPTHSEEAPPAMAFNWFTQGENETEFNCSLFDPGRNKYCFRFSLSFSSTPTPAQTCVVIQRNAETWGAWQSWGSCSVTCGDGVRERVRVCLLPSSGHMGCTGLLSEQSHCSLEECSVHLPSLPPVPPFEATLGGSLVAVVGISLCLLVIVATVLITLWRKVCRSPKCRTSRSGSLHSPGGRKNSDESYICGRSLQRPSFCESQRATPSPGLPLSQEPDRVSPSGQKMAPPIFSYRLAQQQLKEMKRKGLKEATQVYHVSQSPVEDTALGAAASTPVDDHASEEWTSNFRIKSPFLDPPRTSATLPEPTGGQGRRYERTADWVEMVERVRGDCFRRSSSFNEGQSPRLPFRERSLTQVAPRHLPDGTGRTRAWDASDRAEFNWNRRGPSPIQRNILARKLKEANATQRHLGPRPDQGHSWSANFARSQYGLSESEQRMMDLSGYLEEEDGVEVLGVQRLT